MTKKTETKTKTSSVLEDIQKVRSKEKSDFKETVETLMDDKYKRRKTILDNEQVYYLSVLDVIAQFYDIDFLRTWIDDYAEWRTSGDSGKGRQDIVDIAKFNKWSDDMNRQSYVDALQRR